MLLFIFEAAFRSLLMALAVWAGIRIFRVQAVLAQKLAWVLVLLAAAVVPVAMRMPWLALDRAWRIPLQSPRQLLTPAHAARSVMPVQPSAASPTGGERRLPLHRTLAGLDPVVAGERPAQRSPSTQAAAARLAPQAEAGAASTHAQWDWQRTKLALLLLYGCVALVLLLRTLAGLAAAFRLWRNSFPLAPPAVTASVSQQRIRISRELSTPVTIGSAILLPADFEEWDPAKLRVVLAHEQSHVRQGDFYLQALAAIHTAVFWFSPLGWWLQRKLSELGEALSDRAGLAQASSPASYAKILLEFAAQPRTTPLAGVAMARRTNLASRIERILSARTFRRAFGDARRHAILAAALVPAALIAVLACIRIVPVVEAAQYAKRTNPDAAPVITKDQSSGTSVSSRVISDGHSGQISGEMPEEVVSVETGQSTDKVLSPPAPPQAPDAPELSGDQAPQPPDPPQHPGAYLYSTTDGDSFAILHGDDSTVNLSGQAGEDFEKARKKVHGDFLWFEHEGKSYIVTDPALIAKAQDLLDAGDRLQLRTLVDDHMQAKINLQLAKIRPELDKVQAKLSSPEFKAQMEKLERETAEQSEKFKNMSEQISKQLADKKLLTDAQIEALTDKSLVEMQARIAEIESHMEEFQNLADERAVRLAETESGLAEKLAKMDRVREKAAGEPNEKIKSLLEKALKDGKAKPVD